MRLCVFLAQSSHLSRRQAGEYIKKGRIKVNGNIVKNPAYQVKEFDKVEFEGKALSRSKPLYIIFYKPVGVVSVFKDRFAEKNLGDFIPEKWGKVYPVGRLDKNSCGLMLLTNDGELCFRMSHPKFQIEKEYEVKINTLLSDKNIRRMKEGIEDGGDILRVKYVRVLKKSLNGSLISLLLTEGRKREIRRIFKKLGIKVLSLKRVRIGNIRLGRLRPGEYRFLKREQIRI